MLDRELTTATEEGVVTNDRLTVAHLSSLHSYQACTNELKAFMASPTSELYLYVADMAAVSVDRVNAVRQLIDELEGDVVQVSVALLVFGCVQEGSGVPHHH